MFGRQQVPCEIRELTEKNVGILLQNDDCTTDFCFDNLKFKHHLCSPLIFKHFSTIQEFLSLFRKQWLYHPQHVTQESCGVWKYSTHDWILIVNCETRMNFLHHGRYLRRVMKLIIPCSIWTSILRKCCLHVTRCK